MQNPDGGFPESAGEPESNVASTAWAVQGIWAAGQNPETWVKGGNEPLSYMASLQQSDGRLRWKQSADLNGVWMTAYAAPAFAGQTWPIPYTPCTKPPPAQAKSGQGEGTQSGKGVIAGGGSAGAPLFSRPKPQSKGKTPGGARALRAEPKARDHSKTRRGENAIQSTAAESAEPRDESERQSAASGGDGSGAGGDGGSGGAGAVTAPSRAADGGPGREVSGTLVGSRAGGGPGVFGAPGLHSAGVDPGGASWAAAAIGFAALLSALVGSGLELRRREVLP
jgi:hypothetical protein